ncbi:hypothetical protein FQJ13_12420 [Escherichia coli]|nr:hypothetical protein [Escherichia coli]MHY77934.1 hypothetical protein [Escherichia coli]
MHRIDTKTAQKDKFGAGKNGFTRGNPQTGTPATDLDDDYFDMLQEELCSVVEASGASLEKARHDQLLTALRALLLSRKNPFGDIKSDGTVKTALENLGLEDVVHLANFTSGVNWRRTPDGYIEQWGVSPAAVNGTATVTFPIPFPDSCQTIQLTEVTSSTTGLSGVISWGLSTDTITKTGFSAKASVSTSESLNWRALGK